MLKSSHVMDYLDIHSPPSLKLLRRQMHYVDLPRFSFSYPLPYTHMLREAIRASRYKGPSKPAAAFAGSVVAHHLIQAEEQYFDQRLSAATDEEGLIHATDITFLLNIDNSTINDWDKRGDVEIVRKQGLVYVPSAALREVCIWHRPEAYNPDEFGHHPANQ